MKQDTSDNPPYSKEECSHSMTKDIGNNFWICDNCGEKIISEQDTSDKFEAIGETDDEIIYKRTKYSGDKEADDVIKIPKNFKLDISDWQPKGTPGELNGSVSPIYSPKQFTSNQPQEKWEKEFDELFGNVVAGKDGTEGMPLADNIKDFIRKTINREREKAKKEGIEQGRKECDDSYGDYANRMNLALFEAERQAKQDLIKEVGEFISNIQGTGNWNRIKEQIISFLTTLNK